MTDIRTPDDALTVEAFAAEFIHIKGAHKGTYETGEMLGIPCEWCLLAARQAVEAIESIRARASAGVPA